MTKVNKLKMGKQAFRKQKWKESYTHFSSADGKDELEPKDLEKFAKAAYLIGKETDCTDNWTRAHQKYLHQDNLSQAAYCAFWIGMIFFFQGDKAQGSGWIARANRLLDNYQQNCVVRGLLLIPKALQNLREGNIENAHNLFQKATDLGNHFSDPDLVGLGRLGQGQALIQQNKITEGTTLLDETMVAVVSDEISPIVAGIIYCAVIETCQKIYDLRRAQEWTAALTRWCESHPDMIPYRGQCIIRRAEIMQLHGEWKDAMNEILQACKLSEEYNSQATGEAFYRKGELHRLKGNFFDAEESYRQANKWGRNPQPGLSLLRLYQGQVNAAKKAITQVEGKKKDPISRSRILSPYVDIMLAINNIEAAKNFANELSEIAADIGAPFLEAIALRTQGSVSLAKEESDFALDKLRRAQKMFIRIKASYESAHTQMLIGLACRKLGDEDTAAMEFHAARSIFQQLGAAPDLDKINSLISNTTSKKTHGLTQRERQVLCLLATGKTNKTIADDLFISERTVDRHVSNILGKLNVPSRSAATAYAYEHDLV